MKLPVLGTIDARFLTHRLRSTSVAGMAAVLLAGGFFSYHLFGNHIIRWDFFSIIATAAVVKISLLIFYRLTD
jgi:hypothetical protein